MNHAEGITHVPGLPAASDAIAARLCHQAVRDEERVARAAPEVIERVVDAEVRAMWAASRAKTFVSVLALRRVRETILANEPVADPVTPGN